MNAPSTAYVYGVGRDDGSLAGVVGTASGVDGHGVRLVAAGGLVALVSAVPEAAFDEAALQRRLEDLDLLEELARAHHAVVDAAFARAVVLPFRLATVYRDEDRVAEVLGGHRERFTELLGWLDGHVELGVKVHADPESAASLAGPRPRSPAERHRRPVRDARICGSACSDGAARRTSTGPPAPSRTRPQAWRGSSRVPRSSTGPSRVDCRGGRG